MIWFNKSKRVWKAAFAIIKETQILCLITDTGTEYTEVHIARWRRERRRRMIAHKLADAGGYKQHQDYYWHEARIAMIKADKLAKDQYKAGTNWAFR
jgi:hypothetical protein